MKKIKYFVHFHKKFNFISDSDWVFPTAYEKNLDIGTPYICLSDSPRTISEIFGNNLGLSEVGYYAQTIALEYWILHNLVDVDYVGVTGYRRYADFRNKKLKIPQKNFPKLSATDQNLKSLVSNQNKKYINNILEFYDVIIPTQFNFRISVKNQFLDCGQIPEIWDAFINAINAVTPEHNAYLNWFDFPQPVHFCGPMGLTRIDIFKSYIANYIEIIKFILLNVESPFKVLDVAAETKSDRWIGYLGERYYAFFLYAINAKRFEIPAVRLVKPIFPFIS